MRLLSTVTALAAAIALAGCGAGQSGPEKTALAVGYLPVPEAATLHLAIEQGYFKQEGLEVTPQVIQGVGPALPRLVGGQLDAMLGAYTGFLGAQDKGVATFRVLVDSYQAAPGAFDVMVAGASPLRSAAELKGRKVAVNSVKQLGELAVTAQLRAAGLAPGDVTFVEVPFPDMPAALMAGQVAAAWMTEPFISAVAGAGGRKLFDSMAGQTDRLPIAGWAVTQAFAAANPRTTAAFQRAMNRAQRLAASSRAEVTRILPTYTKIPADVAGKITLGTFPTTTQAAPIQRVADLMKSYGWLSRPVDVAKMVIPG